MISDEDVYYQMIEELQKEYYKNQFNAVLNDLRIRNVENIIQATNNFVRLSSESYSKNANEIEKIKSFIYQHCCE